MSHKSKPQTTRRVKRRVPPCPTADAEDVDSDIPTPVQATLDYVSPPLASRMATRLNVPLHKVPVIHQSPIGVRVTAPPMPLKEIEELFGPDSPLTPTVSSSPRSSGSASSPRYEPPSPSSSCSSDSTGSESLHRRLQQVESHNQALQDEVRRLTNVFATTHIEIRICGSPTKRGLPCKNRKGTCPYHSSQPRSNVSVRFAPGSTPVHPCPAPVVEEMWQI